MVLHVISLNCMLLHSFIFYSISLHGIACHFIVLYGIAWYCIVFVFLHCHVPLLQRAGELPRSASSHLLYKYNMHIQEYTKFLNSPNGDQTNQNVKILMMMTMMIRMTIVCVLGVAPHVP